MDAINLALLVVGTLVFASVLAGLYSARAGLSFLLVFLVVGMLAGEDGPGGIRFDDFALSLWIGNAALAVILLDGGLRTRMKTFRTGLKPAAWLASVGVLVTAAITGVAASWLFALPLPLGLLAGAIVGSTDAAAVFSLLRTSGLRINERLSSTLEIESGLNDPMAVFLVLALIALQLQGAADGGTAAALWLFANQLGAGLVIGLGAGSGAAALLLRAPLSNDEQGLTALMLLAGGIGTFGAAGALGGSGFLAVYLFGLIVANRASTAVERALSAMDGYAWFAQALLFLLLGLLVTPHLLLDKLAPALGVAAVLMFVARPVAVALCLVPLRIAWREIGFVSWVGLRGAVPVVLALFPVLAGVPQARVLFDIAFVVVLVSLVLQGATLARAARAFDVNLPEPGNERAERRLYGDFVLDGDASAADVFAFYGLPSPERDEALGHWCARRLRGAPVVGDRIDWGGASFTVRAMDGGRITRIGLVVEAGSGPR